MSDNPYPGKAPEHQRVFGRYVAQELVQATKSEQGPQNDAHNAAKPQVAHAIVAMYLT